MSRPTLRDALAELYADGLVRQAEMICKWPVVHERITEAENHVRLALWEQQIGRITDEALQRIYSTLSFVMPDDGALVDEAPPLEGLEKEAEWERAHQEQLAHRHCPECGDGLCPADERLAPPGIGSLVAPS